MNSNKKSYSGSGDQTGGGKVPVPGTRESPSSTPSTMKTQLREPTQSDKEDLLRTVGVEKLRSVVIRDITFPDEPQGYECIYFPFDKSEFDKCTKEIDMYWTEDRDQMWEEVDEAIFWFDEDWEGYCKTNGIIPWPE